MKKLIKYLSVFMAALAIPTTLISCGGVSQDDTKTFKEVLDLLEKNRNASNIKGYQIQFKQDLTYETKEENDYEVVDYQANYKTDGSFTLSYETTDPKNVNIEKGFDSIITKATGFAAGTQLEKYTINNKETSKSDNKVIREENISQSTENVFIIDTDDSNISVASETTYNDFINKKTSKDNFFGKIARPILVEELDADSFNKGLNSIAFIDVWDNVNSLLSLMHKSFTELSTKGDSEITDYLKNKDFKYEKTDSTIKISYKLSLNGELQVEDNKLDNVEISVEVDKKTGEITNFKIDLTKYFSSLLDAEGTTYFKGNVNTYVIDGKIVNQKLNRANTSSYQYKEYNEETKYEFLEGFIAHAIPKHEEFLNN